MRICGALAVVAVFLIHAEAAQRPADITLYDGARLIAGDGRTPIEHAAILVENGTIRRVGRSGDIRAPTGAARVDLAGKTIIPGLVSLHGHVGYLKGLTFSADNYTPDNIVDQLNRYLYYGIVAMMSTGTDPGELPYRLRNEAHPGRSSGRPDEDWRRRMPRPGMRPCVRWRTA